MQFHNPCLNNKIGWKYEEYGLALSGGLQGVWLYRAHMVDKVPRDPRVRGP